MSAVESEFAIVELMGRQLFGAKVEEVEFCGVKLLHCEVLTEPPYVRKVHPQALYAVTPCPEERARLACRRLASPLLVPSTPAHTALPPPRSRFEDAAPDDIPFDDPDKNEDEGIDEEQDFACEQCGNRETIEFNGSHMDVPDGWVAVPPGWSLVPHDSTEDMFFCSPSCVRAFMPRLASAEDIERLRKLRAPTEPSEAIEVSGPLTMRHVEVLGDWYSLEHKGGLRLTDASVEGTLSEMLLLARAIEARESYSAMRCAARVEGDRVYLWSPYGSEQKAVVSLVVADALASKIRSVCADKAAEKEPGHG